MRGFICFSIRVSVVVYLFSCGVGIGIGMEKATGIGNYYPVIPVLSEMAFCIIYIGKIAIGMGRKTNET